MAPTRVEQQYYYADVKEEGLRKPFLNLGQHDTKRDVPLTEFQYGHLLNLGMSFVTAPITNNAFRSRIFQLASSHLQGLEAASLEASATITPKIVDPVVPPLTPEDTGLFPGHSVGTFVTCVSPWISLGSKNPAIAAISRQVLNLEIAYANFCGVRTIVVPGPCGAAAQKGSLDLAQHARAIQEALLVGGRLSLVVHIAMCPEPGSAGQNVETLGSLVKTEEKSTAADAENQLRNDFMANWDAWNEIRSICNYNQRLFVSLQIPGTIPDMVLVDRWLAEPLQFLVLTAQSFQTSKTGVPDLSRDHQEMIFSYMKLKNMPWIMLSDLGPDAPSSGKKGAASNAAQLTDDQFPSLDQAVSREKAATATGSNKGRSKYVAYLRALESDQPTVPRMEEATLISFQDWLQSPLQPLSDNLESATYEVFEGDPVKYNQYEAAITEALREWKENKTPTSSDSGAVVLAVAGSGRGPLVTRALKASAAADVPIQVWAVEKNPNAYVYLLRQNEQVWDKQVTVVKTDMRAWKGPLVSGTPDDNPVYGKVDILVSELLGSFGDNELSPECLDGIQHVLARPHGISIPQSYTAHLSPIATPRIYSELAVRTPNEPNAFDTPWVVRLFQTDHVARRVPDHSRYQQAWEFSHPIPNETLKLVEARRSGGVVGGGGGSMSGAAGANDHNSRYCQLTFVCPTRGVIHGLAGYFESTLYESSAGGKEKVEISILPEQINNKSKDMISWFPIFFPLKRPLSFPDDTELTVSMWRQTDDSKVWYEWLVDAHVWTGPATKLKVASSDLCSSRKVACLL